MKLTIAQKAALMRATMTFEAALENAEALSEISAQADAKVQAFAAPYGKGPMGLTPEACRTHPTYRDLKADADRAFASVRAFNQIFVKAFAVEYRAHIYARRAAKIAANQAKQGA